MLGLFMVMLDPFLNLWDEQFHALVAKNMGSNPFKPILINQPLLAYDFKRWDSNCIWLHKQPFFLWQMALSIKIFGANEISARLPSLIMHSIIPYFIYRIGTISVHRQVGFYGALFFTVTFFPLELMNGGYSTDHNDLGFLFYVTASFWAWFEYRESGNKKWLIWIGAFAGIAVLIKWLVGLLVYASWGIVSIGDAKKNQWRLNCFYPLLKSFFITLVVFIPWQIYILIRFPVEAKHELAYNTRHFFEPIEGHDGDGLFHFNALYEIYGNSIWVPIVAIIGLIVLLFRSLKPEFRVVILSATILVYLFYTLAATKMTAFTVIVSPFLFLGLGALVYAIKQIPIHRFLTSFLQLLLIASFAYFLLDTTRIIERHSFKNPVRAAELREMELIQVVKNKLGNEKFVVFNTKVSYKGNIPVMFYTDFPAYDFIPTNEQLDQVRKSGYKIAIVDFGDVPLELKTDQVKIIPFVK